MRFYSIMILLSCSLFAACDDKTVNNQAASSELNPSIASTTPKPAPANAATPVISDPPTIVGSGCAADSAQIEFQPQQDSFKLNLAALEIGTGQGQEANITCNLAITVTVPTGYQVSILPLHFAGNLTGNALNLELQREYFFAGTTGTPQVSHFALPKDSQFEISDSLNNEDALQWSSCGQDTNIRVNTRILVKSGEGQAKLKISSTDTAQTTLFKLNYRACN